MAPPTSAPSKPSEEASRHWGDVGLPPPTMINMHTWKDRTKSKTRKQNKQQKHLQKTTEKEKQSHLKLVSTLGTSQQPTAQHLYLHRFQPHDLLQNHPQRSLLTLKITRLYLPPNHPLLVFQMRRIICHCLPPSPLLGLPRLIPPSRHQRNVEVRKQYLSGSYDNLNTAPTWRWRNRHNTGGFSS